MEDLTKNFSDAGVQEQQPRMQKKGVADIVLCVDISGSMKPCVDSLIDNIQLLFEQMTNNPNRPLTWRARIVSYGDLDVDPTDVAMNNSNPFTSDVNEIKQQLAALKPLVEKEGGGDEPENTLDAIFLAARDSQWKTLGEATRFIIVFSDATPKPELHASTVEKNQDKSVNEVTNFLLNQKIRLYLWVPEHDLYKILEKVPGSDYNKIGIPGGEDRYLGLKNQDFKKLLEQLGKTLSKATLV